MRYQIKDNLINPNEFITQEIYKTYWHCDNTSHHSINHSVFLAIINNRNNVQEKFSTIVLFIK